MVSTELGRLLATVAARLDLESTPRVHLDDTLGQVVGARLDLVLDPADAPLELFGQRLSLAPGARASVRVESGTTVCPFDPDLPLELPAGHALVRLELEATVTGEARARVPVDAVVLALSAKTGTRLGATHLLALPVDITLREALPQVVAASARAVPPGRHAPGPDEAHALSAELELDLGLEARLGARAPFALEPFAALSEPLQVRFEAVLRAALGLELLDQARLVVGQLGATRPGWIRLRLERLHQRRLTFGATCALQVKYDLGSPFLSLLDETLDQQPFVRLRAAVGELQTVASAFAAGDLATVRQRLSVDAVEVLADLLEVDDLFRALATDPGVTAICTALHGLVDAYDQLARDERLAALWDRLLGRFDLSAGSSFRRALEAIAALAPDDLDAALDHLLDERGRHAITLLEVLSGASLEELMLGEQEAQRAVATAADLARDALAFLDQAPAELADRLHGFAQRTGLAKAVEQLRQVTSVTALRQAAGSGAARLAERLLCTALERIDEDDLARVRSWAAELSRCLKELGRVDETVRSALAELNGEAGLSLGIELDRLTRTSALLDLEVDPKSYGRIARHLAAGSIGAALERLFALDQEGEAPAPLLLHDCLFTTRRLRSSATSLLLSLVGARGRERRRVLETSLRVVQLEDGRCERRARAAGALVATCSEGDRTTLQAGVWLTLSGSAREQRVQLDGPLDRAGAELMVQISRRDARTLADELVGVERLLADLGFLPGFDAERPTLTAAIPAGSPTRLGITLRFREPTVRALLQRLDDQPGWDLDVLNAGQRWLEEPLLPGRVPSTAIPLGAALAAVLRSKPYRRDWRRGREQFEQRHRHGFVVVTHGRDGTLRCRLAPLERYPALVTIQTVRGDAPGRLDEVALLLAAGGQPAPSDLAGTAWAFATTATRLDPTGWPSPLFVPWLLVVRLARLAPAELAQVRGAATLSFRNAQEWSEPVTLRLEHGLPACWPTR